MKIRNGFVSNSSSASFIVRWKLVDSEENDQEKLFNEAFCALYGPFSNDDGSPDLETWFELKEDYESLKKHTKFSNGIFETIFSTSMLNSLKDLGPTAALFNFVLEFGQKRNIIQVIDKEIDDDNGEYS